MKLFKIWFLSIVSLSLILAAGAAFAQGSPVNTSDSLLLRIKALPGVYVKRIDPLPGFKESFEIALVQPVDHQNPNGSKFTQRMFLAHKDHSKPVLVETEGYGATWQKSKELSKLLDCNQIIVEHRYFDSSKPDPLNWKYLTIKQAASDHHRVIQIFKEIYKSKWITSGRSKGGMAALFHKYYYPEDVDATVAYVAPIMIGLQDPRFYEFLEMKGTGELRQKIRNIQKTLLRRKNDILPIFKEYAQNDGITYSLDPEIVFEYMVAAYPFAFWQGKKNPDSIPNSTSSDIELIDHLSSIVSFSTHSVSTMNGDAPLIYQAITEFGYHGFPIEHLKGLLTALPNPEYSIFAPKDAEAEFNPEIMKNVLNYLENEGDNIIYLYGEYDPWTSCAVEPDKELDALKIIVSGVSHKFDIDDLPEGDKAALYSKLEDWLSIIIRR